VELNEEKRVEEIAHMLSGEVLSEAAIENARALIKLK
jgi:DNA repair protein RecN (Recombination protein N)